MTPKRIAIAFLACALASPTASNAGLITWEMEGTVERVAAYPDDYPPTTNAWEIVPQVEAAGVIPGVYWRARVTFDSDTLSEPCPGCAANAQFVNATRAIDFLAGTIVATSGDSVGDALALPVGGYRREPGSTLEFHSLMESDSTALQAYSAKLALASSDPSRFSGISLPTDPPDLLTLLPPTQRDPWGSMSGTHFQLLGVGLVTDVTDPDSPGLVPWGFSIDGRITSITAVPEPTLLALVAAAAGAIAIRRRSRALP